MKKLFKGASILCGAAVIAAVSLSNLTLTQAAENTTIENGVYIGAVDVGGMSAAEARNAVTAYVEAINQEESFYLIGAADRLSVSTEMLGVTADIDEAVEEAVGVAHSGSLLNRYKEVKELEKEHHVVDMNLQINRQEVAQRIYENRDALNVAPIKNSLKRVSGGFEFVPGEQGKEVNIVDSVYAIEDFLETSYQSGNTEIGMVINIIEQGGDKEVLESIKDCLGSFHTDFSSSAPGRAKNVRNACEKINGTILYPGETLSVYNTISPLSQENGYEMAGSYENGKVVESLGGGICQVSSTLYNAVIRAELEVTMRYNHSMLVSYVPPSDDAAIAGGVKDFKFRNNQEFPIYLEGYCEDGVIYFNVYGVETRPANRTVSFESEKLKDLEPNTEYVFDSSISLGSVSVKSSDHAGMEARLWKIVKVDGEVQSREVFNNSTYTPSPKTVTIGTKGATYDQIYSLKSAAADKKEDSEIRSMANRFASDNAAAAQRPSDGGNAGGGNAGGGGSAGGGGNAGGGETGDGETGGGESGGDGGSGDGASAQAEE